MPLLLAGLSGFSALIYEIVWFQLLQLAIGSSAVSLGLLLAAYMGGLCLGSLLLPRVRLAISSLRLYAYLEFGIAAFGVIALFGVPLAGKVYSLGFTTGIAGIGWRGLIAAACLIPPTVLMGAAFPVLARYVGSSEAPLDDGSRLGWIYSANIAGAVLGCFTAGFYLLRVFDMGVATYAACAINLLASGFAYYSSRGTEGTAAAVEQSVAARMPGWRLVYAATAISGLTALGAEVVWTRLLALLLGATVYAFSIILGVFLIGLWAGSAAGSAIAKRTSDPRLALAACQGLLVLAIALTAVTIARVLPHWPTDPWLAGSPWLNFDFDLTRVARTILPATLLWGASFPLALAAASKSTSSGGGAPSGDPARLAGEVYAANTLGSIVGALAFSLALTPALGTAGAQQALLVLSALGGVAALLIADRSTIFKGGVTACGLIVAILLAMSLPATPWQLFAFGRRVAPKIREMELTPAASSTLLYSGEGLNSSIAIADRSGIRSFYVSGKSEASSGILDMRLQRMMGHFPALFHGDPKSVLVVGFGAGVTAGSFVPYPGVQSITICELEPLIPPASNEYFGAQNYRVLDDPRTHVVYDDARHFVATSAGKFDVITTDPIHPFVKGTSALYSKEYYEIVKSRLNPGGVVAQWLPVYDSDAETVKTELATFFRVFPEATVWSNYQDGDGYDLVLIGRDGSTPLDGGAIEKRLASAAYSKVQTSLAEVGFGAVSDILGAFAGRGQELTPLVAGTPVNDDLSLRLQYLAGLGLDSMSAARTYAEILSYRRFPEGLFTATPEQLEPLRSKLGRKRRVF